MEEKNAENLLISRNKHYFRNAVFIIFPLTQRFEWQPVFINMFQIDLCQTRMYK